MTYLNYYKKCKQNYDVVDTPNSLKDLTIITGKLSNKHLIDVQKIYNFTMDKINKKQGLFDMNHNNIVKVDDFYDCKSVNNLGNFFGDFLEKNFYGCNCIVEAVLIYKSLPTKIKRSSWIWHYDDNINEQLKVMVYLNDVSKTSGAMEVLMDENNNGCKIKTSKIGHNKSDDQVYEGSRIPDINKFIKRGYFIKSIIGEAGTYCLFDPNCIHKATTPTEEPYRLCIVYNFRPYLNKVEDRVSKSFTKTWSNLGNIKEYEI
tara:strand:+ start:2267 stop:3046 length:780 start_codon:yes stop_codon:yes gene_type:complete